ncbi:hypothetical protein M0802_013190 [Mischocyttarus mexicanus]|nr:hypothetical protein M0802_013190 [Mischocyttarus mexicanus]
MSKIAIAAAKRRRNYDFESSDDDILYNIVKPGIPYYEPTFPAGNILDGILNRKLFGEVYADIYFKYRSQPYIGVYSIFKPTLVIIDPEIIRLVLVKEFGSFSDRGMYSNDKVDPLSGNLFLLPGQKWSHLRACWTPILAVTKLKQMFVILKEKGNLFEQFLEKKVNGNNEIEMKEIAA